MALRITDDCTGCGLCVPECPHDAIYEKEIFVIDKRKCDECEDEKEGPRCVIVCPVDCIVKAR